MENKKPMEYNKLFVGGDLSGIQKFLYNITSHKAAVSLKGRSAFLTIYLREVCEKIEKAISEAGDEHFDELYCSGGKFYIITQNTPSIVKAIDKYSEEIVTDLWEAHRGQLGLNICHVTFAEYDGRFYVEGQESEEKTNSGILWKYVNAEFARQKNQKFKTLLTDRYEKFFEVQKINGETKVCAVTGIESSKCVSIGDGLFVLPSVKEQIKLGQELSQKQDEGNEAKTFEDYADGSSLGILRMDVDGLGKRFIVGFDTIADYKAFSKKVKDFFENYIGGGNGKFNGNKLLDDEEPQTKQPYSKYLNVIYAGGDDLFIIGRWDRLINFAELIYQKTEEHFKNDSYKDENGNTHNISISGGIAIVKPKFPIAKAAELAGEAEEASKQIEGKNAFNMFGRTIKWGDEFAKVKSYKERFMEYIQDKDVEFSKSILHKLMLYSTMADMNKVRLKEGKKPDFSYVWHASYYLTRFMEKYKGNEETGEKANKKRERFDFCRNLRDKELGMGNNDRNLKLIAVAAKWAEQELRIVDTSI